MYNLLKCSEKQKKKKLRKKCYNNIKRSIVKVNVAEAIKKKGIGMKVYSYYLQNLINICRKMLMIKKVFLKLGSTHFRVM